jgi:hypothetical protein
VCANAQDLNFVLDILNHPAVINPNVFSTTRKTIMSKRDAYIAKMKLQLDELNVKMAELEAKAQEVKADVRDKYREEIKKLRHQSKLAVAKLDEIKAASESSWEALVAEMEKIRDAFTHSFHYFKSQI